MFSQSPGCGLADWYPAGSKLPDQQYGIAIFSQIGVIDYGIAVLIFIARIKLIPKNGKDNGIGTVLFKKQFFSIYSAHSVSSSMELWWLKKMICRMLV